MSSIFARLCFSSHLEKMKLCVKLSSDKSTLIETRASRFYFDFFSKTHMWHVFKFQDSTKIINQLHRIKIIINFTQASGAGVTSESYSSVYNDQQTRSPCSMLNRKVWIIYTRNLWLCNKLHTAQIEWVLSTDSKHSYTNHSEKTARSLKSFYKSKSVLFIRDNEIDNENFDKL